MELIKIKGNTYYINAPTNIGVYTYKNKNCILVDTGINNSAAKAIEEILKTNGLHPKFIVNTHGHRDHFGGNAYFKKNYPGCLVYTSKNERMFMENPELQATIMFSSNPIGKLNNGTNAALVDYILEEGICKINDEKFEIVSLKGHTMDQIGIITPEKVAFLGDSIYSKEIIEKYSLPYIHNVFEFIQSLEIIRELDADYFVVAHSNSVYEKSEIIELVDFNKQNISKYIEQILELLDQPLSREDLLENIVILNDLDLGFRQYHLNFSTISAFIAYLYGKGQIDYSVENGRLYYFKRKI